MRLKLDENLPHDLATALIERGYEVHTVADEHLTGHSDAVVVHAATRESRMVPPRRGRGRMIPDDALEHVPQWTERKIPGPISVAGVCGRSPA